MTKVARRVGGNGDSAGELAVDLLFLRRKRQSFTYYPMRGHIRLLRVCGEVVRMLFLLGLTWRILFNPMSFKLTYIRNLALNQF